MKRIREFVIIALFVGLCVGVYLPLAATQDPSENTARAIGWTHYISDQVLTPNSTTVSSLTVPARANCALISVETANVRYRDSGTAPTTAAGHLVGPTGVGQTIWLSNRHQLENFKVISVSTHGVLQISYGD